MRILTILSLIICYGVPSKRTKSARPLDLRGPRYYPLTHGYHPVTPATQNCGVDSRSSRNKSSPGSGRPEGWHCVRDSDL